MQIFREFTQKWQNHTSEFNGFLENNVLYDFFDYCDKLKDDFTQLKKYKIEFNSFSKKTLDEYESDFLKLYACFSKIVFGSYEYANCFSAYYLNDKIPSKVIVNEGDNQIIPNKYYVKLKQLAERIFKIEAEMADIAETIWLNNLSSTVEHNTEKYSYLAHLKLGNWRRQGKSTELDNYANSLKFMSASYINQDKTKFYMENRFKDCGLAGYILSIKKGAFIAGSNNDMFSTELVDGKCEYYEKYSYSPVKRLYIKGNSQIFGNGTRIATPQSVINAPANTVNEVILDRDFVTLERVFYVKPYWDKYNSDLQELVAKMSQKTKYSEPVRLCCFNKLPQANLDDLYM